MGQSSRVVKSVNFLGTVVEAATYDYMFGRVDQWLSDKTSRSHHIALINTNNVVSALLDPSLARIYGGADIAGPDARPFVCWIRALLRVPCDQFDASSVLLQLAARARETGYTFYLYGGHPDVLLKMKANLESMFPHMRIVGYKSPPFRPLTAEEDREICSEINRARPDILCIGLGTPKQDYWIDDHLLKIRGSVMIPCGAIFDFFGGRIKRAPRCIQVLCLEWLHRLLSKDFRRLFKRYTLFNVLFLWNFALQLLNVRVRQPTRWQRPQDPG